MSSSLPKGLRRYTRHYSETAFIVDRLAAGHAYNFVLTTLRRVPSLSSPSSSSDLDPAWSSWASTVDSSLSVWRVVFSSDDARRQYTPFFVYDLTALDYESIAIWRRLTKFVPLDSSDRVFPAPTDRPPSVLPGAEDSSGASGESDSDQTRAAGKRPQPPSPGPPALTSGAPPFTNPPSKKTRVTGGLLPLAPSVVDPSHALPSTAFLDPHRVCPLSSVCFLLILYLPLLLLVSVCLWVPVRCLFPGKALVYFRSGWLLEMSLLFHPSHRLYSWAPSPYYTSPRISHSRHFWTRAHFSIRVGEL